MKVLIRVILCSILILGIFGSSHAMGQFFMFENPLVGEKAPDFTLKSADGKEVNLSKFKEGQNAMVFFWATWCPHCREQLQHLSGPLGDEMVKKGIKIVLVDIGETPTEVNSYIKKNNVPFEVLLDQEEKVSEQYSLVGVPTFIFIDKGGIVRSVQHSIPDNLEETFTAKP